MASSSARWLIPTVVLIVTAAVYLPALNFGFVLDDSPQIVLNQGRFTWQSIPGYFTTDVWSYIFVIKTNYYRPIFMLWLMLNYQLFGLSTALWHASMIAAHLAVTLMVYFLALRLTGGRTIAGAASLVFGVHPVHVEAVAWISGSTETLVAMLGLGTILCHLRWRDPGSPVQRKAWRAAEIGLFAAAMFAKETAIVLPVLVFAWEWLFPASSDKGRKQRLSTAVSAVAPDLWIFLFYILARVHALGTFAPRPQPWSPQSLILTWPLAVSFYLRQLLIPFQYSLFYPFSPVTHFGVETVIPLLAIALAAGFLVWFSRQSAVRAFCVLLLVLPILPVLNLRAFTFDDFLHDRYVYVSSAGLCILVAIGLERLIPRLPLRAGVVLALVGALALVSVRNAFFWNDNLTLYNHAVEIAPESATLSNYLAAELTTQERWADALPLLSRALLRDPSSAKTYLRIAKCYVGLGEVDKGIAYFKDAIAHDPDSPAAYVDLAAVEFDQNLLQEAEDHMRDALRLRPKYSPLHEEYHYRLGVILEHEQKRTGALAEYQAEIEENPASEKATEALENLQKQVR